jgi:hypothetical protein
MRVLGMPGVTSQKSLRPERPIGGGLTTTDARDGDTKFEPRAARAALAQSTALQAVMDNRRRIKGNFGETPVPSMTKCF